VSACSRGHHQGMDRKLPLGPEDRNHVWYTLELSLATISVIGTSVTRMFLLVTRKTWSVAALAAYIVGPAIWEPRRQAYKTGSGEYREREQPACRPDPDMAGARCERRREARSVVLSESWVINLAK
jgi:hypothetical protein